MTATRSRLARCFFVVLCVVQGGSRLLRASEPPLLISVDASDSARRLFHSDLSIPVHAGPLTLVYPRWGIPTYEFPVTVLDNIVRLKMSANGRPVEWKRDTVNMFAFHIVVPEDATLLHVAMDVVVPPERSDLNAATPGLFVLDWYTLFVYPEESALDELQAEAELRLPVGWTYACSLEHFNGDGVVKFRRVPLSVLADSPVLAGKNFGSWQIPSRISPPVFVDVATDTAAETNMPAKWQDRFAGLLAETGALFGGYPYQKYHFLLALSDDVGNDGLEHRESSDIRLSRRFFWEEANRLSYGYLIPHEFVHAWNGKYRIPAGLVRRNFQEPQTTELLWVYEGLTRYLNWVLATRSGILSEQESRDYVALLAAQVAHRSGREWRSLQDTAISAGMLNDAPDQWQSLRRGTDYYDEALFLWLEADSVIRGATKGQRSLDDFCREFFAGSGDSRVTKPYTFDELVSALNHVATYDWKQFLRTRLDATGAAANPLAGLAAAGWDLSYATSPNSVQVARDQVRHTVEERFSLGLLVREDGTIIDVIRDSAAWQAGLGPEMKITQVNGLAWSPKALRAAVAGEFASGGVVNLTIATGFRTWNAQVDENRGSQYPTLRRNGNPDNISTIVRPIRGKTATRE